MTNDGGSIILVGSFQGRKGSPGLSAYCASKAAVRSLGRTLAQELSPRNIRVNVISPGIVDTPIMDKRGLTKTQQTQAIEHLLATTPIKRVAHADEIAAAMLYLASDDASFMSGANLACDGGLVQV